LYGGGQGPALRGWRLPHESQAFLDDGLCANAEEFREKLHELLLLYVARDRAERKLNSRTDR
jgi:hypothetical protein